MAGIRCANDVAPFSRATKASLNFGRVAVSGERTRPRVQFPASRRKGLLGEPLRQPLEHLGKTVFGETPNTTREDAYAPRTVASIS